MRKERNCNMYPMYQGGMMPMMPTPIPATPYMGYEQQLNSIQEQINNLDSRVTKLENASSNTTYENKYNDSNYYML